MLKSNCFCSTQEFKMSVTKSDSDKVDEILKTLLQINKRMDNFENKLEGFNTRLTSLNQKLDDRYNELKVISIIKHMLMAMKKSQ